MKNLNFSPKGPTIYKAWVMKLLFIADQENVKKNTHMIGWVQNYRSKGAKFCGMIALSNE